MPKDPRIKKVLVIGSGPIIIGQAAEFDYSCTQAYWIQKGIGRPGKSKTRPATKWNGSTITHLHAVRRACHARRVDVSAAAGEAEVLAGEVAGRAVGKLPLLNIPRK